MTTENSTDDDLAARAPQNTQKGDDPRGPWVLLWSRRQGFMHIEPLASTILSNHRMLASQLGSNDYILMAIGSHDEVSDHADRIRPLVDALESADRALRPQKSGDSW